MKVTLGETLFDTSSQQRFADSSGDWNPIHMDPVAARRTQSGAQLVHGMHGALCCLNAFAKTSSALPAISKLSIKFEAPIYVGDHAVFVLVSESECQIRLAVEVRGIVLTSISITSHGSTYEEPIAMASEALATYPCEAALNLSFIDIEGFVGQKQKIAICRGAAALFPDATQWIGGQRVAALVALSPLVGMRCPGLHSIFLGLTVTFAPESHSECIDYSVASVDDRFHLVHLAIKGGGLEGEVQALVRTPPVTQLSINDIARRVEPMSFIGQHALIVGGSRGLGECVAKAIAAGGSDVTISYSSGVAEAKAIEAEILTFGGRADVISYDVLKPSLPQLERLRSVPTHVYYFATNRISGRPGILFDPARLDLFMKFYVNGLFNLCSGLFSLTQRFKVFFPSTVYVEKHPKHMTEYAMAKAAGEVLCADLNVIFPGVTGLSHRFPRLKTDQTSSAMPETFVDTLDALLPEILAMQSAL